MHPAALILALVAGAAAPAVEPAQSAPEDGLQLEVDLVDRTIPLSGQLNLSTPVHAGYRFRRFSFLLGAYYARGSLRDLQTGDFPHDIGSVAWWFELSPSVRYHFRAPESGALVPFAQASFDFVLVSLDDGSTTGTAQAPRVLGFSVGGGGEFLLSSRFGFVAAATLRYLNARVSSSAPGRVTTSTASALALGGCAGVALHF